MLVVACHLHCSMQLDLQPSCSEACFFLINQMQAAVCVSNSNITLFFQVRSHLQALCVMALDALNFTSLVTLQRATASCILMPCQNLSEQVCDTEYKQGKVAGSKSPIGFEHPAVAKA